MPVGVVELVETFIVLVPEPPVIGLVLKVADAPEGSPFALRVTLPVKPPEGVTVAV